RRPLAHHAHALVVVPVVDAALDAVRRAAVRRAVEPRTAAKQPVVAVVAVGPLRIDGRTRLVIAARITVEDPLEQVAVYVVQPEGVGREGADLAGAVLLAGVCLVVDHFGVDGAAEVEGAGGACAAGVLPFRLTRQADRPPRLSRRLFAEVL